MRNYLHRLLLARALPSPNCSRLLEFLGRNTERMLSYRGLPATQLLHWLESTALSKNRSTPWRPSDLSQNTRAELRMAPIEVQRLVFLDLQLRYWHGNLFSVPVLERSRFFGQLLDFFTRPPSGAYPVYPPPEPQPKGRFGGLRDVGPRQSSHALSHPEPHSAASIEWDGVSTSR